MKKHTLPEKVIIYTDGASRGNPGPGAYGVVVTDSKNHVLLELGHTLGNCTNNYAEYMAVIEGLKACHHGGAKSVLVRADSQLMVRQMIGEYKVKAEGIKPLAAEVRRLMGGFEKVNFEHVRREDNSHADRLANEALDGLVRTT